MTQDRPTRRRRGTTLKLLGAAVVVVALVIVLGTVDLPDPSYIRDRVASAGPWGIALFVVLYAILSATPFPASTLTIASGLLFGLAVGATVVVFAATMGAYLGYWGARALGRDFVLL